MIKLEAAGPRNVGAGDDDHDDDDLEIYHHNDNEADDDDDDKATLFDNLCESFIAV